MSEKQKHITHSLASLAVAASSKFILEGIGASVVSAAFVTSPILMTTLLAAGAYYVNKIFSDDDNDSNDDNILKSLQRTSLDVQIASDGQMSTTVSTATETNKTIKEEDQLVVEKRQGTTIFHINNLTINLNSEIVQQLNINPKEVINQLTDQIEQTSLQAIAQDNKELPPKMMFN